MRMIAIMLLLVGSCGTWAADDFPKPYSAPCTERENVFAFAEKPKVKNLGNDKYEITFATKGNCDVAVGLIDPSTGSAGSPQAGSGQGEKGTVVRHLGAGVLGSNAPAPFQKNSLKQTIYWNGKDDLDVYVKEPGKLRVRVMLGLKPEFDKRLGGTSPCNLPGYVWSTAVGPEAAYVFSKGQGDFGVVYVRKYDHDGNYLASLVPPPANMPEEKLGGMGYMEYEPGARAVHSPELNQTLSRDGFLPPAIGRITLGCQIALAGDKFYFTDAGATGYAGGNAPSFLYSFHSDGATDLKGLKGLPLTQGGHCQPRLTASPDGRWIYMTGLGSGDDSGGQPVVLRRATDGLEPAKVFIGNPAKPGVDDQSLNNPIGLDCDAQGRLYVCDSMNNRVQIYSPDGELLKTVPVDRAALVRVHQKTGAIYVRHAGRVEGQSVSRLTKFTSFDAPREECHMDGVPASLMSVDSWTAKPRLWLAGTDRYAQGGFGEGPSVTIWEEEGKTFRKIRDFDEEAKREAGANYLGRWSGNGAVGAKVVCDPTREALYYRNSHIFDLKTGAYQGRFCINAPVDDIAFDKRCYMHCHFNPGHPPGGVGRVDAARPGKGRDQHGEYIAYPEIPYDYGDEMSHHYTQNWKGVIWTKDQPGAKYFQDGIGVNMCGDVAEECNIYYVPKMEEVGLSLAVAGVEARGQSGKYIGNIDGVYQLALENLKKMGEDIYYIRRRPGIPLAGGTIWTFDRNGERRAECAITAGGRINGVQIDEDGKLYCVINRIRLRDGKPFLADKSGIFGNPERRGKTLPQLGTLMKTRGQNAAILSANATIPLEDPPKRPEDLQDAGMGVLLGRCWVEGAEWLYAGASPITFEGCSCPAQRLHVDWYKRVYVPEAYRHSVGILDTNGNLIMHMGRYGNPDSIDGPKSKIPVGGDGDGCFMPRYLSGTDNYFAYDFRGEALVVLKLNYHAEETVGIGE